ncbi:MAG TPA: hypothetical protein VIQ54_18560, partial [Polyangia bacterium]
ACFRKAGSGRALKMTSRMPAITFLGTAALAFVASGCFHTRKRTEDLAAFLPLAEAMRALE